NRELRSFPTRRSSDLPKREIPELELHYPDILASYSITEEMAKEYEVGLVKQKSIMSGKITFRVRDGLGQPIGYVGYQEKDGSWLDRKSTRLNSSHVKI